MAGIALIADKNTATCFKLAGLKDTYPVENAEEAEKCVRELSEKPNLAIILVTERIVDQNYSVIKKISERKQPLIVPIPDTGGPTTMKTDFIVELIKRKAGIEVKLG
ncbi:MAG: V-type ATP synthase subunit F [Candidatus Bathyarchaeota archaeon]|nr:MAG: V-type ATP synthase subunit F [Candidatus Bathyarchaeota archaeon]